MTQQTVAELQAALAAGNLATYVNANHGKLHTALANAIIYGLQDAPSGIGTGGGGTGGGGLTAAAVELIVQTALAELPPGITEAQVKTIVDTAIAAIPAPPAGVTQAEIDTAIATAIAAIPPTDLSNYYTKAELDPAFQELSDNLNTATNDLAVEIQGKEDKGVAYSKGEVDALLSALPGGVTADSPITVHTTPPPSPTNFPFTPREFIDLWADYEPGLHLFETPRGKVLVNLNKASGNPGEDQVDLAMWAAGQTSHGNIRDWGDGKSILVQVEGTTMNVLASVKGDQPFQPTTVDMTQGGSPVTVNMPQPPAVDLSPYAKITDPTQNMTANSLQTTAVLFDGLNWAVMKQPTEYGDRLVLVVNDGGTETVDLFVLREDLASLFPEGKAGQVLSINESGDRVWVDPAAEVTPAALSVSGINAAPIPTAEWVSYTPLAVDNNLGSWDVDGSVFVVPEAGMYAVSGQLILVPSETSVQVDVFLRLTTPAGIVSGSSLRVTSPSTVVKFEDTVQLDAGDRVQIQLFTESGVLSTSGAGAGLSIRKVNGAPRLQRPVWQDPPAPFSEPILEATSEKPRSVELTLPAQTLGATAKRAVAVDGFGGAAPAVRGPDISIGSEVGRLLQVEGRVQGAQTLLLETATNGYVSTGVYDATGKNPNKLQLMPTTIMAKATSTRATFDGKSGGPVFAPGHIYVRDSRALLSLTAGGNETSGGKITLTDVTPHDFIGDVIKVKGSKPEAGTKVAWESTSSGIIPTWDELDYYGRVFATENLPKGNYRITGKVRVKGAHDFYRLEQSWNHYPKDQAIIPTRKVMIMSDGTEQEMWPGYAGASYNTLINDFTVDYYYDTYITRDVTTWCGLSQVMNGANGIPLTVEGELKIERVAAGDPWYSYKLEAPEITAANTNFQYPIWKCVETTNIGRPLMNGGVSWAATGAGDGKQSDLTGGLMGSNNRWSFRTEKWTVDLFATDGAVTNIEIFNRRAGTSNTFTGVTNLGGGHYRLEGVPSPVDSAAEANFGRIRFNAVAGTKVRGVWTVEQTQDWIAEMQG